MLEECVCSEAAAAALQEVKWGLKCIHQTWCGDAAGFGPVALGLSGTWLSPGCLGGPTHR